MNLDQRIDEILEELEMESKWGKRLGKVRAQLPPRCKDPSKFLALRVDEYLTLCDRKSRGREQRHLLVLEPLGGFHVFDHLLPACFAGQDDDGTSLELFRFRQDELTGIEAIGKVTAHGSRFHDCSIKAGTDGDGTGVYFNVCRVEEFCQLESTGECKISGGHFGNLSAKSGSRIEIFGASAGSIDLHAPFCRVALIGAESPYASDEPRKGKKLPPAPTACHIQSERATLYGSFSEITGHVQLLTLQVGNLPAWRGSCHGRQVVMSPQEFTRHLASPYRDVLPTDKIMVSGTSPDILIVGDEEVNPDTLIRCPVDISRRCRPWEIAVENYIIVSRERKQSIHPDSQRIRLLGSDEEINHQQYQAWQPLEAGPPESPSDVELF